MKSYDKWKKRVIQIACKDETNEEVQTGTATILFNNGYYYLLTAKHVITKNNELIYNRIVRVPSYDEEISEESKNIVYVDKNSNILISPCKPPAGEYREEKVILPGCLMCLDAGTTNTKQYSLDEKLDLAVISLTRYPRFIKDLLKNGYQAASLDDIGNEPSSVGADIFCIGYPNMSEIIGSTQTQAISNWSSDKRTLPLFSFGKVSLLNKNLDYFWGDVRVYDGNSGSPVIEDDKLVGIVFTVGNEKIDEILKVVPFAKAIKARYIKDLLSKQEEKNRLFDHTI